MRTVNRLTRGLCTAALGVLAWSTLVEPRLFTLRRHTLPVLPDGAAPLRVLQLSDLHLAPWQHRKIDWVRGLVELRPDLVVLTGDLMGHRFARGPLLHALRPFAEAGISTVFVHGSNDYFGPIAKNPFVYLSAPSKTGKRSPDLDNAALTRELEGLGFVNLNNRAARLTLRGTDVEFMGLNDPHISYDDIAALDQSISGLPGAADASGAAVASGAADASNAAGKDAAGADTTAGTGNTSGTDTTTDALPVRIGVVHAPYQRALGQLLDRGSKVIFAGHTHGGQVRVPGVGALTANCDIPVNQARGLSVWFDSQQAAFLNVSAGLGASIFAPIRFACRPEASLLTLESAR